MYKPFLMAATLALLSFKCAAKEDEYTKNQIKHAIRNLDHEEFDVRESALEKLFNFGESGLPALKAAIMKYPERIELVDRARRVIRLYETIGLPVKGLRIQLTASRNSLRLGEAMTLTTTISNSTHNDLNLSVGFNSVDQSSFETGSALSVLSIEGEGIKKHLVEHQRTLRGAWCGVGSGPIFVTIPAQGKKAFSCKVTLGHDILNEDSLKKNKEKAMPALWLNQGGSALIVLPKTGTLRIRMSRLVQEKDNHHIKTSFQGDGRRPSNENAPFWTGMIYSNELQIEVDPHLLASDIDVIKAKRLEKIRAEEELKRKKLQAARKQLHTYLKPLLRAIQVFDLDTAHALLKKMDQDAVLAISRADANAVKKGVKSFEAQHERWLVALKKRIGTNISFHTQLQKQEHWGELVSVAHDEIFFHQKFIIQGRTYYGIEQSELLWQITDESKAKWMPVEISTPETQEAWTAKLFQAIAENRLQEARADLVEVKGHPLISYFIELVENATQMEVKPTMR